MIFRNSSEPVRDGGRSPGVFRFSSFELLGSLVLFFVAAPFLEQLPGRDLIEAGLLSLVMVLGVLAVGGDRWTLAVALLLALPTLVAKWASHLHPEVIPPEPHLVASTIFFGCVITHLMLSIIRAPRVDECVICAGVSGYLMLGMMWIPAYILVARLTAPSPAFQISSPAGTSEELDAFHALYFSFITLTTVGYGDILPVSRVARMLASMEAIAGVFYMALLISRLVSVYSSSPVAVDSDRQCGT